MLDHVGFKITNLARSRSFYDGALKPLGISVLADMSDGKYGGKFLGYGDTRPYFWIEEAPEATEKLHVALTAPDRATVDAFYKAALAAAGKDNGPPGLRPHYHPDYYGAFVLDPDGHNIEAVCHKPG